MRVCGYVECVRSSSSATAASEDEHHTTKQLFTAVRVANSQRPSHLYWIATDRWPRHLLRKFCCYHGLRGSASPVLTAIGSVNGKRQFSTPTESTPLNRSPKNSHRWPRSCAKFGAHASTSGFWANGWNITKIVFIYLFKFMYLFMPFFRELTYRSDMLMDFCAWWLKRRGLAQGCAFLGFGDMAPHLGVKTPKTPILGAWIGVFKANSRHWTDLLIYGRPME